MSKLSDNYRLVSEGRIAQAEFLRQARQSFPGYINQFTSYQDAISILRRRGLLSEDVVYQCMGDKFPIEQIDKGIRVELENAGIYDTPTPEEYKKAKTKAIDTLCKDPLAYIQAGKSEDLSSTPANKVADSKMKNTTDQMQKVKLQEGQVPPEEEDRIKAQFKAKYGLAGWKVKYEQYLKQREAKKDIKEEKDIPSEEENRIKAQFKAKYGLAGWEKKYNQYLAQRSKKEVDEARTSDKTKAEFSPEELDRIKGQFKRKFGTGWEPKFNQYLKQHFAKKESEKKEVVKESQDAKEMQLLREAVKKTIVKIITEAATVNLTKLSDENASIQGIPGLLNNLVSIVTEIESFILKEQNKIQSVFEGIGDIKNEDGIPIGYKFAGPILDSFKKDLEPVLDKINFDNIKVPEAPKDLGQDNPGEQLNPEEEGGEEEKKNVFSPKGLKPDPLAESKKVTVKKGRYTIL